MCWNVRMSQSIIQQPRDGERLNVVGEQIRILADSKVTDGKYVVFEEISPPGGGPPLHRHDRDDEFFFVVDGAVKFQIDGRESALSAGGAAHVQSGSIHTFANVGSRPSRMIIVCCPGGIEEAFREADELARSGAATPEKLAAVFHQVGIEFLGPPLQGGAPVNQQ